MTGFRAMKPTALAIAALLLVAIFAADAGAATLTVRGSVEQVQVTGAAAGARLTLVDRHGATVDTRRAGSLGAAVFRDVTPGAGYRVRHGATRSGTFTVLPDRSTPPSTKLYGQKIPAAGYGYL